MKYSSGNCAWYSPVCGPQRGLYVREPSTPTVEAAFAIAPRWPPSTDKLVKAQYEKRIELKVKVFGPSLC